jgi:uncharacterized protein
MMPPYVRLLFLCWSLFLFRVMAQGLQYFSPVSFLPSFSNWQSGLLPYPLLVFFQVAILTYLLWIVIIHARRRAVPNRKKGRVLLILASIYVGSMLIRYPLHIIRFPEDRWLGGTLPIFFHLVLATFLATLGQYHFQKHGTHSDSEKADH